MPVRRFAIALVAASIDTHATAGVAHAQGAPAPDVLLGVIASAR